MDKQVDKNTHFWQALRHAKDGMVFAVKQERNIKIHIVLTCCVIILGWLLKCSVIEWLWLLLSITLVFICEFVNTMIEEIVDQLTNKHYFDWAKHVKDLGAGTVIIATIFACIVGIIIFVPKLLF